MKVKNKQIEIAITGTKKDGYVIKVSNKGDKYNSDILVSYEELTELRKLLNAYYAKKR